MATDENRPVVGFVTGDPAGIGPEITLKAVSRPETLALCRPLLFGPTSLLRATSAALGLNITLYAAGNSAQDASGQPIPLEDVAVGPGIIMPGENSTAAGLVSLRSLARAYGALEAGCIDALVMAPLNKESLGLGDERYHSEFDVFADLAGVPFVGSVTKTGTVFRSSVTGHIAFRDIVDQLSVPRVVEIARVLRGTIRKLGVASPRLAVAALNPHAGEGGVFGDEEERVLRPAVAVLKDEGIDIEGPIPADTVYVRARGGEFDGVVFLYHDQGNIATKAGSFLKGVVIYTGIPYVIVSPSHGTAFDIVGKGVADDSNLVECVRTATAMSGGIE